MDLEEKRYPFHGQCDLVLMHTPDFENGLGLDLHIRTTIQQFFSFIENAALRIGENILEIHSGGVSRGPSQVWMNGELIHTQGDEENDSIFPIVKEGFTLTKVRLEIIIVCLVPTLTIKFVYQFQTVDSENWDTYEVTLPVGDMIRFHVLSMYITIETHGSPLSFEGTVGLKGDFHTGDLVARDGVTKMDHDTNAFGQEWQVRDTDPKLFRDSNVSPQWPDKCILPDADEMESRRLAYSRHDTEFLNLAEKACSTVSDDDVEFCMFDVLSTGDLLMAEMFDHHEARA